MEHRTDWDVKERIRKQEMEPQVAKALEPFLFPNTSEGPVIEIERNYYYAGRIRILDTVESYLVCVESRQDESTYLFLLNMRGGCLISVARLSYYYYNSIYDHMHSYTYIRGTSLVTTVKGNQSCSVVDEQSGSGCVPLHVLVWQAIKGIFEKEQNDINDVFCTRLDSMGLLENIDK